MKRILFTLAAALATALSAAAPAQAAPPPTECTSGSHSDLTPPHHTHWLMGQRSYQGSATIFDTTYRLWLHENPAYSPPLFVSAANAKCGALYQTIATLTPTWQTGNLPCTASGDYQDPSNSNLHHRFIGQRVNRVNSVSTTTALFRFWVSEEAGGPGGWYYRGSSVVMC